ncbi:hypothetical protein IUK39_03655 [Priestia aryabhattai]|uniref:hypothetical protein n=1 Tax=Priestia aryabhattai TaxID=412384 RepID=UPI001C0E80EB|nr:hypothetical protein [Priestia aryabhattai]MBU3569273.1 hypothetical protein [Priestia aryabhattai]
MDGNVKENWQFWRPVVLKVLSYTEAIAMSEEQLANVNKAIDFQLTKERSEQRKLAALSKCKCK